MNILSLNFGIGPTHAIGATTYKLKFGHRGGNQPKNGKQRRYRLLPKSWFASDKDALEANGAVVTNTINDNTVSGMRIEGKPACAVPSRSRPWPQ